MMDENLRKFRIKDYLTFIIIPLVLGLMALDSSQYSLLEKASLLERVDENIYLTLASLFTIATILLVSVTFIISILSLIVVRIYNFRLLAIVHLVLTSLFFVTELLYLIFAIIAQEFTLLNIIPPIIIFLFLIFIIIYFIFTQKYYVYLTKDNNSEKNNLTYNQKKEKVIQLIETRYKEGKITKEEYDSLLDELDK